MNTSDTGGEPVNNSQMDRKILPLLLSERNIDLWDEINRVYKIELEESPEDAYLTYFDEEVVVIEINMENLNQAAFTHEILHVYLKARGLEIIWDLRKCINEDQVLKKMISTSLRVHLGNCLEHVKMLPIFLSRGFKNEDFLLDYHRRILDDEGMLTLEQKFQQEGRPSLKMVDQFIDKFFSIKASNNPEFNYSVYLERFEKLDPSLFNIHQTFWEAWIKYEVGEPKGKYLPYLNDYMKGLKTWKKTFLDI